MRETTPARTSHGGEFDSPPVSLAMPPCFERWCSRFDDLLRTKAQKREFKNYLGGLLGESERKNISQMAKNAVGVNYYQLHHFVTEATWSSEQINERRLQVK